MFFVWLLLACSGSDATAPTAETPPPAAEAPAAMPAGHGADHMAVMSATRERLRAELGDAYDQPVAGLEEADLANGKAVYEQHCVSCHGVGGKGDGAAAAGLNPAPADFTDAFHARYYSDAGRVRIIAKGSPETAMAAFEGALDAKQILDVYAYVRAFRGAPAAEPAAPAHDHGAPAHDHGDGSHQH